MIQNPLALPAFMFLVVALARVLEARFMFVEKISSAVGRGLEMTPSLFAAAFVYLSGLRGEVSGLRFDAYRLSEVLRREGLDITPERAKELAE